MSKSSAQTSRNTHIAFKPTMADSRILTNSRFSRNILNPRTMRKMRNTLRNERFTPIPPDATASMMNSPIETSTMNPSRRFHGSDQYARKPSPRCLNANSTMKTIVNASSKTCDVSTYHSAGSWWLDIMSNEFPQMHAMMNASNFSFSTISRKMSANSERTYAFSASSIDFLVSSSRRVVSRTVADTAATATATSRSSSTIVSSFTFSPTAAQMTEVKS